MPKSYETYVICGTDTPKKETCWDKNNTRGEWPQSLFGFLDASVSPCEFDCDPVAESSAKIAGNPRPYDGRNVSHPDHAGPEIVRGSAQDERCSGVEDVEPNLSSQVR